jgi:basic membrane protein A
MAHGGGSIVMDETMVPKEVQDLVKAKEEEIRNGLFRVNVNDAEPKSTM